MSLKDSAVYNQMGFAPLDLIDVLVGGINIKLYPHFTKGMPVHECGHAYQINKAALTNLPADFSLILDAFGVKLNASLTVEGIMSGWRSFFKDRWMDFGHLTILSFHQSDGNRIDDTTVAADPQVLLPVVNGALAICCKQDVKFVQVQFTTELCHCAGFDHT
jgi:hypothetical protein